MTPRPPQPHSHTPAADTPAQDASLLDELSPVEYEALRWSVRVADGLDAPGRQQFDAWLAADATHRAAYADMAGVLDEVDALPPAAAAHLSARVVIDSAAASAANALHSNRAASPSAADATPREPQTATRTTPAGPSPPANATPAGPSTAASTTPAGPLTAASATPAGPLTATNAMPAAPSTAASATPRRAWLQHALAGVAVLATVGAGWAGYQHWQQQPTFQQHYATARGQQLNTDLPDGSRLQLDTATAADVTLYRDHREVRLTEGQAVFKVHGDKARPFDVLAGDSRITVVGTKFSVRYLPAGMQVAVMEGKVRVQGGGEVRHLLPGQTISAGKDGQLSEVSSMPVDAMASWLSGRLSFDNAPLIAVLAELARYGDTGLQVHDAKVGQLTVTASVNLRDPQGFARSLPRVLPVRLRALPGGGSEIISAK